MNPHKYLRAYMAGIVVPTIVIVLGVIIFCIARYVYNFPPPLERIMIFPMAAVPNLWGLWNMLFIASRSRTHLSARPSRRIPPLSTRPSRHFVDAHSPLSASDFHSTHFPNLRRRRHHRLLSRLEICRRLSKSCRPARLNSARANLSLRAGSSCASCHIYVLLPLPPYI